MNIDANSAGAAPAPVPKAGAASARQRAVGDTAAADSAGTASFMSMLLSLAAPAEEPGLSVTDGSTPSGQRQGAGDGETAAQADADWPDGAVPMESLLPADAVPAVSVPARPDAAAARSAGTGIGAGVVMAADAHAEEAFAKANASAAEGETAQARRAALDDAVRNGAQERSAAAADSSTLARQQAAEVAMAAREGAARADTTASAKDAAEASTWRALVAPQSGANAASVVSMFEAGLIGLRAGPGGRVHERGAVRVNNGAETANGGFIAWTDAGPGHGASQAASPVYAPGAATPAPAAALAQKLHFWVAGGVQSAELQLDAFEGGAVDVHIAVKGDEAYVEFRSDQPQARKLLLDAMPQLKEMLAGEGLMLSGGFVGGSAQRQSEGDGTRRERFSGARTPGELAVQGQAGAAPPVRGAVGSSVDLFV